jgi:hypothetical protein
MLRFVRFQSPVPSARGTHVGVFALVNGLGRRGVLSGADELSWREHNRWFEAAYVDPSTVDASVYDRQTNPLATAWFTSDAAADLVRATAEHCTILDRHGVAWERVESDDPGRVVYEDRHQVVVVPHGPGGTRLSADASRGRRSRSATARP